jgi:DNA-binding NarL/FixJ family response regulator
VGPIRVLVVDDYEDWRRRTRLLLQARRELQIVGEGSDGVEAIRKAEELGPDLILLDVGLPTLNGIEAARQIRQLSPNSKIIFVSQDNSQDVVKVALDAGALGFVYKARAGMELLPAIDAVLQGKQFVTSMLKGYRVTETAGTKSPNRHEVQFYSDDAVFLDSFARFIGEALKAGDVAISIATLSHLDGFSERLTSQGLDVDAAIKEGRYIPIDAAEAFPTFMVNGMPDPDRYFEVVGGLIKAAAKAGKTEHPRAAVCGEMAPLLWAEGKADAAIRLEQLSNQLAAIHELDLLCGYSLSSFRNSEGEHIFRTLCAEHSKVVGA